MRVRNIVFGIAIISLLAGCSMFGSKQVDYKAGAVAVQPLEVPPDLVAPPVSSRAASPAADGTQVANYSDLARAPKVEEAPCVAPDPAATQVAAAKLLQVDTARFILVSEPFDRAWRKVSLALEHAKLATGDVNRSKGVFYLKKTEKQPSELRVLVQETQGVSVVTVAAEATAQAEATRILDLLYHQLEK
ncbi:MAG: hypothetical protein WC053_01065 [Sideroxydans sp.]